MGVAGFSDVGPGAFHPSVVDRGSPFPADCLRPPSTGLGALGLLILVPHTVN